MTFTLNQQSPNSLAPRTGFVEDTFSTDGGAGASSGSNVNDGSGSNASEGERQMKLLSLACRSPPAVWPGS